MSKQSDRKGPTNKDIVENILGRSMTDTEIDNFNTFFTDIRPTREQTEQYARNILDPLQAEKRREMEKLDREFKEGQKRKERADKAKLLEMEDKEREVRVKRQIAEHLFAETERHKTIRARWQFIQRELRDLSFSGTHIKNSEQRVKNLETEREELKKEYMSLPFEYPTRTFYAITEYRYTDDLKFINENGEWKLRYKNTDIPYIAIYKNGIPVALEFTVGNYTLSNMFASSFYKQKVRIPVRFSPSLESKEENIAKSTETEKKGILEKVKQKLS